MFELNPGSARGAVGAGYSDVVVVNQVGVQASLQVFIDVE